MPIERDLETLRTIARAAQSVLEANRQRIDDLNVYPVPDGDTGTNLALTVRAIVDALDASQATTRAELAKEVTRAALMGARGNSGVILSQIVRGAAEVLGEADRIDGAVVARALRSASDAAYAAVRKPVEGTMLTAIREMAEAHNGDGDGLGDLAAVLRAIVTRGDDAVRRTTGMLDVLRDAGVVDAGAAGLLELVRGVAACVAGEPLPEAPPATIDISHDAIHQELSRYRYCTVFVIEGDALEREPLERELEEFGDSLLVVGDASALKVHVHTDEPGRALGLGTAVGVIGGVEIANMHAQTAQRTERLAEADALPVGETDVVAVASGAGNRRLFESLGARKVVDGGRTMNPATADILRAVNESPADEVIVLPNNPNVIMSAEQAAAHAEKPVHVIATRSIPEGLAAIVAFVHDRTAMHNADEMREAVEGVATGAVTVASRDVEMDGLAIEQGRFLGLAGGRAVAGGPSFDDVAAEVVDALLADGRALLTLLAGEDAPPLDDLLARVRERHPDVEIDVEDGGQPHYPLLLSAE